jgi:riboflavin synthase
MFTGLIEIKGTLAARKQNGPGAQLDLRCQFPSGPLELGESISVDGVCLTVQTITRDGFLCDASSETLARTTLGALPVGAAVNLERATPLGGRMGGHIVSGHVDAVGVVLETSSVGNATKMVFGFPPSLARFIAEKGSIAVNGISLTVNGAGQDDFHVVVIPHTAEITGLQALTKGSRVNLEVDVLARYVLRARQIDDGAIKASSQQSDDEWMARLRSNGYL